MLEFCHPLPIAMPKVEQQDNSRSRWWYLLHAAVVALHPISVFLLPWRVGEADARMAIGLLHKDPVRRRRLLCAACYLSVGSVKVMLLTFALFLAAIIGTRVFNLRAKVGVGWIGEAMTAIVWASVIAAVSLLILTLATSLIAAAIRQPLWIDEWAHPATALDGRWPPVSGRPGSRNIVGLLGVVPSTMVPLITLLLLIENPSTAAIFIAAMSGTIPANWIARRVVASTPAECFPEPCDPTSQSNASE